MKTKYEKSKQTRQATKERRKTQDCKVRVVKLSKNKLNRTTLNLLNRFFLEAKWLYNHILNQSDIFNFNTKIKIVQVCMPDKIKQDRTLTLPAQIKQGVHDRIKQSILDLSKTEKSKRGKLKFKSQINSLYLKQFNGTHKIINNNYIKITGIKQKIKVKGLEQIPIDAEITTANLIRKHGDYYLHITYFIPKPEPKTLKGQLGIDFGIETDLSLSNGIKLNIKEPINECIKQTQRKISRSKKGSKNREKLKTKLQKLHSHIVNQKQDKQHKILHCLDDFQIAIQNDNIHNWMKRFGKAIQQSAIGGIIEELKHNSYTLIVDRYFPSTKLCNECGKTNHTELKDRIYICNCGNIVDRDIHSAINILNFALSLNTPTEHRIEPDEDANLQMLDYFQRISGVYCKLASTETGSPKLN